MLSQQTVQIIQNWNQWDRERMLAGIEQPRQEPFVLDNGDLDLNAMDQAWAAYHQRRAH